MERPHKKKKKKKKTSKHDECRAPSAPVVIRTTLASSRSLARAATWTEIKRNIYTYMVRISK